MNFLAQHLLSVLIWLPVIGGLLLLVVLFMGFALPSAARYLAFGYLRHLCRLTAVVDR